MPTRIRHTRASAKGRLHAGLLLLTALCIAAPYASVAPLRVLFIGNSLTAWNDLPAMFAALAAAGGHERPVTRTVTSGGFSLEDHWNEGRAQQVIQEDAWDFVVLQQGPSALPESRTLLVDYTRRFAEIVRRRGGAVALYQVWPSVTRRRDFSAVHGSYQAAASAVGGTMVPAGDAWRRALETHKDIALYSADGLHPTREGTYLAALVMYRALYQAPVENLPSLGLPDAVARRLRDLVQRP